MKPDIADAPPSPAFVNAPPCSTSWAEKTAVDDKGNPTVPPAYGQQFLPYATCGYTPSQLQGAYGTKSTVAGGIDGHGQTVAIVDAFASPTIAQDANQYATTHGQPAGATSARSRPSDRSNDSDRRTRPVRRAGLVRRGDPRRRGRARDGARRARRLRRRRRLPRRRRSSTRSTRSSTATWPRSSPNSYGNLGETGETPACARPGTTPSARPPSRASACTSRPATAATRSTTSGTPRRDFPASHPLVTAVGGTSLGVSSSDGYLFETGWGTTEQHADQRRLGSGAARRPHLRLRRRRRACSTPQPDYQKGVVPEEAGQGQRRQARARGARRQPRRRPEHGHARRPDADVPRRDGEVQRVPHRRHEPVLAAHGGRHGPGRPAGGPPARLRQPGALRPVRHRRPTATPSRPTSRSRSCATTS